MKSINEVKRANLHRSVLAWYRKHRRALQWRTTTNPYEILVSEIMLQQTQVSRVREKLPLFLKKFPTIRTLAKASKADVILAWQGMGYNNRALRLSNLANIITGKYDDRLPSNIGELQSLPGIGPYTAHAVACFAFHERVPVVDVNIKRVLSRIFWTTDDHGDRRENEIWQLAERILPKDAYSWNQALMDLGAAICTARKPQCSLCPVRQHCKSKNLELRIHTRLKNKRSVTTEPSYRGLPRRIWRGKIIQTLRDSTRRRSLSLMALRKAINLTKNDQRWLSGVVLQLEKEGLVRTKQVASFTYISLAA